MILMLNVKKKNMSYFMSTYDLKRLAKQTCFKNPANPSCVDLFLTNLRGVSKMTLSVLKRNSLTFTILHAQF